MFYPSLNCALPARIARALMLTLVAVSMTPALAADESAASAYKELEWIDLLPQEDLDALMNPPEYLDEIVDGSEQDTLASNLSAAENELATGRWESALVSTRVVDSLDGEAIRLPGFIVPLEFGEDEKVTKFFLVPYFGACLHMPPPPPNQIVYAEYAQGLELSSIYDPFWLEGKLATTLTENEVARSAYFMAVDQLEPFE